MDIERIQSKLAIAVMRATLYLRASAPKDTGNLAYVAIKYKKISPEEWIIYVDLQIAPYMPYTTEKWVSSHFNGKKNPNEGWWKRAVKNVYEIIKKTMEETI